VRGVTHPFIHRPSGRQAGRQADRKTDADVHTMSIKAWLMRYRRTSRRVSHRQGCTPRAMNTRLTHFYLCDPRGVSRERTRRLAVQTSVLQPHHRRHTDHSPHLYNTHPLLSPPTHTQTPSHTRASCNTLPVWVGVHSTTHTHATKSYMVWYVPLVGKTPLSASWSGRSPKLTPVRSLSTQTATRPHESVSQSAAHEGHVGLVGQKRSARRKKRKPHHRCVVAPV